MKLLAKLVNETCFYTWNLINKLDAFFYSKQDARILINIPTFNREWSISQETFVLFFTFSRRWISYKHLRLLKYMDFFCSTNTTDRLNSVRAPRDVMQTAIAKTGIKVHRTWFKHSTIIFFFTLVLNSILLQNLSMMIPFWNDWYWLTN